MSAVLDCALSLARQKVRFFPVLPNSKAPAIKDFSSRASSDPEAIVDFFGNKNFNSGIACGKVAEGLYLVGFDIDNKDGRDGYGTVELMAELGEEFPPTWTQKTPSGGEHRLFWSPVPIRQGANVAGQGVDFRGDGGYLVGPGSSIDGVPYLPHHDLPIARFPEFAIRRWEKKATVHQLPAGMTAGVSRPVENQVLALKQAVTYLRGLKPVSRGGRNEACFKTVARIKDFGVDERQVFELLLDHWKCEPMLDEMELLTTISNTYRYGRNPQGLAAPENLFPIVEEESDTTNSTVASPPPVDPLEKNPIDELNESYFYYAGNGSSRVCWETKRDGRFHLERFPVHVFHEKLASKKIIHNGKEANATRVWMEHSNRRTYDFLRFHPGNRLEPNEYNLWRGFAVTPESSSADEKGLASMHAFLGHVKTNICGGDEELYRWLISYMAHIFQKPEQKPGVSLVFRGKKGTGKTIISEILGHLIGNPAVILSDKTHALGHFNSIMEDKLLVTLDEAFWSGDKGVEGILKDVITGRHRIITHKGFEPYKAEVFDRVIIIGNERWIVPASADERRFACFTVTDGRIQDRKFFGAMLEGLYYHGGDRLLMQFFMDWDLSSVDVGVAPDTQELAEQKELSLGTFEQWWLGCLREGTILGAGVDGWPEFMKCGEFYSAFQHQLTQEGHRGFRPTRIGTGMILKHVAPSVQNKHRIDQTRAYKFPSLDQLRAEWDLHFKSKVAWD